MHLSDRQRRQALAAEIVDKQNHWFAAAYVNRIWNELMGQSFYQHVDDLGPMKEVIFRRYKRLMTEQEPLPKLVIIDGGKGQLSAAMESITELGLEHHLAAAWREKVTPGCAGRRGSPRAQGADLC